MSENNSIGGSIAEPNAPEASSITNTDSKPVAKSKVNEPVVKVMQKTVPVDNFETFVKKIKETGSVTEKLIVGKLEDYVVNMRAGIPLTWENGHREQYSLWKTLQLLVENTTSEEFRKVWNIVLTFFNKYSARGEVFHESMVFRFSEYWNRDSVELDAFQRLLNLIRVTCNPATRKVGLKQVSLEKTLKDKFTEQARQKIISFYMQ